MRLQFTIKWDSGGFSFAYENQFRPLLSLELLYLPRISTPDISELVLLNDEENCQKRLHKLFLYKGMGGWLSKNV